MKTDTTAQDTYDMMMQLAADIGYYADRINHRRLGHLRRSLQKIEDVWMADRDIDGFRTLEQDLGE